MNNTTLEWVENNFTDSQKSDLKKLDDLVNEMVFNLYYETIPGYEEITNLLQSFMKQGIEFNGLVNPYDNGLDRE